METINAEDSIASMTEWEMNYGMEYKDVVDNEKIVQSEQMKTTETELKKYSEKSETAIEEVCGEAKVEEKIEMTTNELSSQKTEKYEIVSKIGYLLGVQKTFFENNQLLISVYDEFEENKHARIIRNLCIIRTILFRKFRSINNELTFNLTYKTE